MSRTPPFLDPINDLPGIRAAWVERIPNLAIEGDRDAAMRLLRPVHEDAVRAFGGSAWWRAEQVHGNLVANVPGPPTAEAPDGLPVVSGADGLVTGESGAVLAIYVADCGPIWVADPVRRAAGLLHSGKKGTEGNILAEGIRMMEESFGSNRNDLVIVLGPCIRPPHYEVDFAALIARQAAEEGVTRFSDCGLDTGADLTRFYSYRMEQGKTGRMMALITIDPIP